MILAIDIGNTNVVVALFDEFDENFSIEPKLRYIWRIFTDSKRTGDEYFSIIRSLLRSEGIEAKLGENFSALISDCVLSSVVPNLTGAFITVAQKITGKKPILVNVEIFPLLPIKMHADRSHQIGSDLICNALEGFLRFNDAVIVVDFGTALTFTAVGNDSQIKGIAIAPGLATAIKSLSRNTAQLPQVPLVAPPSVLGTNTENAMQAGVIFGYKGLVEAMISRMKTELSEKCKIDAQKIHVLATGGLNSVLKPITECFEIYDEHLTLKGLVRALFYCKNSKA